MALWTVPGAQDAPAPRSSPDVIRRSFLLDDTPTHHAPGSAIRSTKEVWDKLVDGDFVPMDGLSQVETTVRVATSGVEDAKVHRVTEDQRQVCVKPLVSEDAPPRN